MVIISLSIPDELLKQLDAILGGELDASRSEIVRQAVHTFISEYRELDRMRGNIIATVTVLYEKMEKNEDLFHLQHEFGDIITAYLHSHLTERNCLEVMVVRGSARRLKKLIDGLKANKPVKQIKFFIMSVD